ASHPALRRTLEHDVRTYDLAAAELARQSVAPQLRALGAGLRDALKRRGIVFGDFRVENLGIVHRDDGGHWVTIDPGNVAVVR
ncbi:MAG TPA: hypothetical protein VN181_07560, partial [Thermoanaerobaculia bacterium]|nr:hypothetical protein [Thermoanaerobaculia bacterium]